MTTPIGTGSTSSEQSSPTPYHSVRLHREPVAPILASGRDRSTVLSSNDSTKRQNYDCLRRTFSVSSKSMRILVLLTLWIACGGAACPGDYTAKSALAAHCTTIGGILDIS